MENHMSDEETSLLAMQLASFSVLPMSIKLAFELDVFELIKKAGPNASVSASEIAAQLPTTNPDAASMLDRILRFLAAHSVLVCSQKTLPDGGIERRYSLAPVCKFYTKNEDGVSLAPLSLLPQDKVLMETWYHMKDAILEGGVPFDRAYGMHAFEYAAVDPRFNNVFNRAMFEQSTCFMKKILGMYNGFEGLKSLVDVAGGIGANMSLIVSKYPSIKGINFDLPHVIREAPSYPGVEHIGGDMFASVPKADAIFMKWICHDWSDAHCVKLLKNCYEALPQNGKVIMAESVFPEDPDNGLGYSTVARSDVIMLAHNPSGKERTQKEFEALAKEAGFKELCKICCAFNIWIMEFRK